MATVALPNDGDILVEPTPKGLTRSGAARLDAIDMLRGLVIAIMVLDHARDFFHYYAFRFDPTDPTRTWPLLFATRWVTHLCAATFVFLSGVSIYFQKANGKTGATLSAFLLKRGLWLVFLECTVVPFDFNLGEPFLFLQVIWAIGMSMICMAGLARLPSRWVLAIGLVLLLGYPLVAAATAGATGLWGVVRTLAIGTAFYQQAHVLAFYAVIPWLSVMCLGFGLAPLYRLPRDERVRRLLPLAIGLLLAFALLRLLDGYGDPLPWAHLPTPVQTFLSFMNVSKYPPSPDYVFATLGVSILLFLMLEALRGPLATVLLAYGRTPLFTYICHIYILHLMMVLVALAVGVPLAVTTDTVSSQKMLQMNWGFGLGVVYSAWLLTLCALIPLSLWFAGVKRRRRDWWLSYL